MKKVFFSSDAEIIAGNLFIPKNAQVGVLILHGGGESNRERFMDLQKILYDNSITSLAIDFRGVGESTGVFKDGILQNRLADAKVALNELRKYTDTVAIFGSSMGGFVAALLTSEKDVHALILLSAAAYSHSSEDKSLNEEFTKEITKENSWVNSRSFSLLEKWDGKLLVIYGEHDTVIPEGVKERYKLLAEKEGEYVTISGAGHNTMVPENEEEEKKRHQIFQKIIHFLKNL